MIDRGHAVLSVTEQCRLLSIPRSTFSHVPRGETAENLTLMRRIDEQFLGTPFYGVRQMTWHLRAEGERVNPKRIRRLMRLMDLMPIYQHVDLPAADDERAGEGTQDLAVPAARTYDHGTERGLVR